MGKLADAARKIKPAKPHRDFPLFPHATGRWAKKVRGKLHYFGPWADPQAALEKWLEQRDDLLAGRTPRVSASGVTLRDLANRFLTVKRSLVTSGELVERSFRDYFTTCKRLVDAFGPNRLVDDLAADDFERFRAALAKTLGPVALGNEIQRVRTVFKYGYEAALTDRPMRFGPQFKRPAKHVLRKHRAAGGGKMLDATSIRAMLEAACPQLRAMILLGANAALGNHDVGTLSVKHLDLASGWLTFPRPKTGVARRCPLWPETIEAIKIAMAGRPAAKDEAHADLVFVTKYGKPWAKNSPDSPVSKETRKLLGELKIHRPGLGFYSLRHVFRTVADATRDFPAVRMIMGHADESIDATYREHIDDDRLQAVVDHVRTWMFGPAKAAAEPTTNTSAGPQGNPPSRGRRSLR